MKTRQHKFDPRCGCGECNQRPEPIVATERDASAAKHTPTPWKVEGPFLERSIFGERDLVTRLAGTDPLQSANAAFIVHAVNSHEALLDFVKWVAGGAKGQGDHDTVECSWEFVMSEAKKFIAKAEGK